MKKRGLSTREADNRLKIYGFNEIKETKKTSSLKILLRQIKSNFVIYLLFFAMVISFIVGKHLTGYVILVVIVIVIVTGFIQEYKAEKAINALKEMIISVSSVIRGGSEKEILSREIVPGDILILRNGDKIPADCIVLEENGLRVDESILTGESKEIKKFSTNNLKNYKEENTVFMGSFVINGKCICKVVHTGMNTKFGKIAKMISIAEKELPLQKKVNRIAKYMALIGFTISLLTGAFILLTSKFINSEVISSILILVIALSVSSFPEGFPVVLITALSIGSYRMAKKNAIVNRMSIIETLGETTVICSDKTGTITKSEMTVKKIFTDGKIYDVSGVGYESKGEFALNGEKVDIEKEKTLNRLIKCAVLCNNSHIYETGEGKNYNISGPPTEAALLIMGAKAGLLRKNLKFEINEEIPFSSERKMMSVLCKEGREINVYSKGALEMLLQKCSFIEKDNKISMISEKDKNDILEVNKKMTSDTFRVVALAYKKSRVNEKDIENNLVFLGLTAMENPPREEIKDALIMCRNAGIKVKIITGDDKETTIAISNQIGLEKGGILEGNEIDRITDNELIKIVNKVVIFARVKPEHKLRIVRALKENEEIVTMTGDGVNDAPALKEAHIGVAMGKSGTDVSRSVSDLILKDDNFATIVEAVKEGRTVFNNIRKFVSYQLSCNYSELAILFIGVLLTPLIGWPVPVLLAIHILFMNIVTDNIPAITLGFNPSSKHIMNNKPRKKADLVNKNFIFLIIFSGSLMAFFTLLSFYFSFNILKESVENARTTALFTLILLEIAAAFNFRSFSKGVLDRSPFINKYLFFASVISVLATLAVIYTPLSRFFDTVTLGIFGLMIALGLSLLLISIFDIFKKMNEKRKFIDFN